MNQQEFLTTVGGVFEQTAEEAVVPGSVALSADLPGTDSGVNSEYLNDANSAKISAAQSWTFTGFVYPQFLASATNPRGVFSKGTSDAHANFVLSVTVERSGVDLGYARCYFSNGVDATVSVQTANGTIAEDTWYFIEVTYDHTTEVLSIALDRGTPATRTSTPPNEEGITADMRVGGTYGTGINDFQGQISLIGFWERVLSSAELNTVYNAGIGTLYDDLGTANDASAYFELDEVSGTRVDSTGGTSLEPTQPIGSSANVPS